MTTETVASVPGEALGPDGIGDAERLASLEDLRERYAEARNRVPVGSPHGNLDWILGARSNPTRAPLAFSTRTLRLIGLWLQDLASDLERPSGGAPPAIDGNPAPAESLAGRLRAATRRFLVAFRRPA